MKKWIFFLCACFGLWVAVLPAQAQTKPFLYETTQKLFTVSRRFLGAGLVNFSVSANGKNSAYTLLQKNKEWVVFNGKPGKKYDEVSLLTVSPDGKNIFYAAKNKDSDNEIFVTNEKEEKRSGFLLTTDGETIPFFKGEPVYYTYSESRDAHALYIGGYLKFTPKGNGLVYTTYNNMTLEQKFVVEGKEFKDYYTSDPQSNTSPFVFSEDGTKVGFFAMKTNPDTSMEEGWWVVENLEQ